MIKFWIPTNRLYAVLILIGNFLLGKALVLVYRSELRGYCVSTLYQFLSMKISNL